VDTKCNQGDELVITYDLRKEHDNISYLKNGKNVGKGTLFEHVT
jgi:hypothetical protein